MCALTMNVKFSTSPKSTNGANFTEMRRHIDQILRSRTKDRAGRGAGITINGSLSSSTQFFQCEIFMHTNDSVHGKCCLFLRRPGISAELLSNNVEFWGATSLQSCLGQKPVLAAASAHFSLLQHSNRIQNLLKLRFNAKIPKMCLERWYSSRPLPAIQPVAPF